MQGWRSSRETDIEMNIELVTFDETDPPDDLYFNILNIPTYADDGTIQYLISCQQRVEIMGEIAPAPTCWSSNTLLE
jgi:hypothetical protein